MAGPVGVPVGCSAKARRQSLALAVNESHQFAKLCVTLNTPEWLHDARFANARKRREHARELQALVEQRLQADTALAWEAKLCDAGVAASAVRTLAQSLAHPGAQRDPDLFGMERGRISPAALKDASAYRAPVSFFSETSS